MFIVAICLSFVGVAYLFLWPGSELFGIIYVSDNRAYVEPIGDEYLLSQLLNINEIEINTNGYDIKVVADDSIDCITAYVKNKVTGFALKKNSKNELEYDFYNDITKLVLNMREVKGWVSASGSYIKIHIPEEIMRNNIKLKISTGKKSDINIEGGECASLSCLDIKINRGELYYNGLEAQNVYLKANKAEILAGPKVFGKTDYMYLDIGNSHVNLLNAGEGAKYLLTDEIPETDKINYKVNNLVIKSATKKSRIRLFNCGHLYTDTNCEALNGTIQIYYVEKAHVKAKDTKVWINKLTGPGESEFTFTGKGGLDIVYNYGNLNATSNSGNILVSMSNEVMSLETNSGKILVNDARKPLSIIVYSGEVNIDFDENPEDSSFTVDPEIILLRTHSGNIKINDVENINLVVDEGGKPNIEICYKKVVGLNVLDAQKASDANIMVIVPENEGVELDINSYNSILNINVGATKNEGFYNGTYHITVYTEETDNILQIDFIGSSSLYSKDVYELKK